MPAAQAGRNCFFRSSSWRWRRWPDLAAGLRRPRCPATTRVRGIPPDQPRQLADFSLTDSTGRAVTREDMDGKILAVSFLFTGCGLTCPEVSQRMADIQRLTTNQPDVRLVSLTVDPRSDTPPVLAKWGARYGADTNRWLLLTGGQGGTAEDSSGPVFSPPMPATLSIPCPAILPAPNASPWWTSMAVSAFTSMDLRLETPAAVVAEMAQLRKEK